jgi:hypothetical protein
MTDNPISATRSLARLRKISVLAGTAVTLAVLAAAPAQAETAMERRVRLLEQELTAIKAGNQPTQREAALEKRVIELENELKGVKGNVDNVQKTVANRVVRGGRRDVTVDVYGQVNRGVLLTDDGTRTSINNVDNDASSTRFGFLAKGPMNKDVTFGANIELEIQSNPSNVVNQFNNKSSGNSAGSSVTVDERKLEAWVDSKTFGKLSLGQGDMASNNTAEQDLSGTAVATGYSDSETTSGGYLFGNKNLSFPYTTNNTLTPSIASVLNNLDGLSRQDRVRYDTPTFYGFSAATSTTATIGSGAGNARDAALYYSGKLSRVQVAAAAAMSFQRNSFNIYDGSISALDDSGVNVTFAAGSTGNNGANRDPRQYYYVKLGYQADWFQFGKTAFAIDWTEQTDQRQNGDYARVYGAYVVQNIDASGTELYLAVKNHQLFADTGSYDHILAVLSGLRVPF